MKKLSRILACLIAVLLSVSILSSQFVSSAAESYESIPYTDYIFWNGEGEKKAVPTKALFSVEIIRSLSSLGYDSTSSELTHIVYDSEGKLYILDSTGMIIVLNTDYTIDRTISEVYNGNETLTFEGAKGIYVDRKGVLYICDTENRRVLCCKNEKVEKIITQPDAYIIPEDFIFSPTRILLDERDYIYLLCDGCYYGLMVFSPNDEFIGFFGANNVANDLLDAVTGWITEMFNTTEKHDASLKKLPYQMTDICMSSDGFVCAVNSETVGQLRMFATTGDNILRYNDQFESGNGDDFNFADYPNEYLDKTSVWNHNVTQSFAAVAGVDGYLYALDSTQGRIYVYDNACNIISVFGGGLGTGEQSGTFVTPISIAANGDEVAVIDMVNKNLTVFKCTDFGKTVKKAQLLTLAGDYESAFPLWEKVNAEDKNFQLAYLGLSKYYLAEKNYKLAMEYSKIGNDQVVYSQAFRVERNNMLRQNLWWILIVVILSVTLVIAVSITAKTKNKRITLNPKLRNCLSVVFHPIECFGNIKNKQLGSVPLATAILFLFYICSVAQKLLSGFMYENTDLTSYNSFYTFLGTVGVMILFIIVNWAACILFEGKGKLKEIYIASCYCLIPQIFYSIFYIVLSYIMVPTSNSGFSLITTVFQAILVIWLILSITVIHDFSFFKALGLSLVIVLGIAICAFVLFAVLTLAQDLLSFILGIIKEIMLR